MKKIHIVNEMFDGETATTCFAKEDTAQAFFEELVREYGIEVTDTDYDNDGNGLVILEDNDAEIRLTSHEIL